MPVRLHRTITGFPTPLYDPVSATVEITARTTDGRVLQVENAAAIWSVR